MFSNQIEMFKSNERVLPISSDEVHEKVFQIISGRSSSHIYEIGRPFTPSESMVHEIQRDLTKQVVKSMISKRTAGSSRCLVCSSPLEAYKRGINKGNIRAMIAMASGGGSPVHINKMNVAGGDFTKLTHWGLIRQIKSEKGSEGWVLTEYGQRFLHGQDSAYKSAWLFKGRLVGFEPKHIMVRDAKPFDQGDLRSNPKDYIVLKRETPSW